MAKIKSEVVLIAHNLRSCHNVGSLFRTAEGLGVGKLFLTGYTPYPVTDVDDRLPHIAAKLQLQIDKTALGTNKNLPWQHEADIFVVIEQLKKQKYTIVALEQTLSSINITTWLVPPKIALVIGRETAGIEPEVLVLCDIAVEIPMQGKKESFNVVQATAMALFHCRFSDISLH